MKIRKIAQIENTPQPNKNIQQNENDKNYTVRSMLQDLDKWNNLLNPSKQKSNI